TVGRPGGWRPRRGRSPPPRTARGAAPHRRPTSRGPPTGPSTARRRGRRGSPPAGPAPPQGRQRWPSLDYVTRAAPKTWAAPANRAFVRSADVGLTARL